jgi:hypothetical protein
MFKENLGEREKSSFLRSSLSELSIVLDREFWLLMIVR